jgi:hypothetical protein
MRRAIAKQSPVRTLDPFADRPPEAERPGFRPASLPYQNPRPNRRFGRVSYIMSIPPMPPGMPAPAGVFSGASATIASVVRMFLAMDAAF